MGGRFGSIQARSVKRTHKWVRHAVPYEWFDSSQVAQALLACRLNVPAGKAAAMRNSASMPMPPDTCQDTRRRGTNVRHWYNSRAQTQRRLRMDPTPSSSSMTTSRRPNSCGWSTRRWRGPESGTPVGLPLGWAEEGGAVGRRVAHFRGVGTGGVVLQLSCVTKPAMSRSQTLSLSSPAIA